MSTGKLHKTTTTRNWLPLFSWLCLLLTTELLAATDGLPARLSFQRILENRDLALGEVEAIFQDSTGYMWFGGANGLMRYDGYEFREIKYRDAQDASPQSIKFVTDISEGADRKIWVGTRAGIFQYDPLMDVAIRLGDKAAAGVKLSVTRVGRLVQLNKDQLLACSDSGLFFIETATGDHTVTVGEPGVTGKLQSSRINAAHIARDGRIWLGGELGLEIFDPTTQTFRFIKPYAGTDLPRANRVMDLVGDGDGKLWIATSDGLLHFDPATETSTRYVHDANDPSSLGGNDLWRLWLDHTGALWIASDGGGVSVFDKKSGRFSTHRYEAGRSSSINTDKVRTVFEDRNGDIWVGNYPDGINYFDRSSAGIVSYTKEADNPNSLSLNSVLSVQEDKQGNLWLGTDGGGLNHFDRTSGKFTHFRHNADDPASIGSDSVLTTYLDSRGDLWVGTWGGGMARLDRATGKFIRIPFDDGRVISTPISTSNRLNSAHVWSIKEDRNKDLWVSTHTGGISRFDRDTGVFTHYVSIEGDPNSLGSSLAWTTYEDSHGNFWVGTSTSLERLDRKSGIFTRFLPDPADPSSISAKSVLSIHEDRKERLWFGTEAGLNLYHAEAETFSAITKADGLNDDTIRQILEDADGNLWLSTNNGVSRFNPDTRTIKNYNRESGRLLGGFATESGIVSRTGEMIFGGINGLRIFNPAKLRGNDVKPPVVLTDFKIFADSIAPGGADNLLSRAINYTDRIVLDYSQTMFVFDFAALNFRDSGKNQYAYMLEGFDKTWLDAGAQRSAKYTNLNAGTYTFKVKASNNDGLWNEEGRALTIVQLPPPWKTWWAYTLYICAIVAALALFVRRQRAKREAVEAQNRLLEIKVAERTAELRQKNNDIQAMLANMPQGLFTLRTGEQIDPEYSAFLERIFETNQIAGRSAADLLFTGARIGADVLDATRASIFAIIGEDEMNFDFNAPLLVREYETQINGRTKHLTLDWSPIIENETVQKLMVSVRDVTELRKMEAQAQRQRRELDIISQLLNLSAEKYLGFEESAKRYVHTNRDIIEACEHPDQDTVAQLFRNMHTIKGNCRTYGFNHLSDTVHEVESAYSTLRSSTDITWDRAALLADLDRVEKGIFEYADVYRRVLGRGGEDGSSRRDGFWMAGAVVRKIEGLIDTTDLPALKSYLNYIQSSTLDEALVDVIASLSSIAIQLDKKTPMVAVQGGNLRIKNSALELVNDVFAHILRNCIDHGIESPDERIAGGKPERGAISIRALPTGKSVTLFVKDDGRGLDMAKLAKKAKELRLISEADTPSPLDIAQLIFRSGVSTKDVVTDISGRGVGMDAVKRFITQRGGDVAIILNDLSQQPKGFLAFELVITLPQDLIVC